MAIASVGVLIFFIHHVPESMRPYVATDRTASIKMMEMIGNLVVVVDSKRSRRLLVRFACSLRRECREALPDHRAIGFLDALYRKLLRLFEDDTVRARAKKSGDWMTKPIV